jgi:exopolysaccharide biosynthesis polyprenyl glycosylphosphotransferase
MATSDFWQRLSASMTSRAEWEAQQSGETSRIPRPFRMWMAIDFLTVLICASLAIFIERHYGPWTGASRLYHGTLFRGRSMGILLALLFGYSVVLILESRRLHLYSPERINNIVHEQWLSLRASLGAGLLLAGALYLLHADDIPRKIVLLTVGLVTLALGVRRYFYRNMLYRRFSRGLGTRNVLIVGTGPEANALRTHLATIRHLGYAFKGYIEVPDSQNRFTVDPGEVIGTLDNLFQNAREKFVDEIFFTNPWREGVIRGVVEQSRANDIDLRVIPDLYDGLAWNNPIEYVGQFPTIPLHRGEVPEVALFVKRVFDIVFSAAVLILLSPFLLFIALAIKFDSPGPAVYASDRIGKKGNVFRCFKFRTMVVDADKKLDKIRHMNERDGVLFKVAKDPRITRVGRILRKYSLDEMPQFFNVLLGEMSVVGPRPPLGHEVKEYDLGHLRRLDVTPGITGLWQVQGRSDPSFARYVSLDVTYIENWSIWLDIMIIFRTIGVIKSGTGT